MKIKAILIAVFILFVGLLFSSRALACATGDCRTVCLDAEKPTGEKCTSFNGDNSQEGDCCVKKSGIDLTSGKVCAEENGVVVGTCSVGSSCWGVGPGLALAEKGQAGCPSDQICCKTQAYHDATQGKPEVTSTAPSSAVAPSTASLGGGTTTSGLVPCTNNCTLCHLVIGFKRIFNFFIGLLFVATMLAITICGVFYMVSSGSKGVIEMAKKGLTYSLMAFAIGMGGWLLINTVMIGMGFQHPYGGNWWEFTCDTTPGQGPIASGTAPNWTAGKDNQNQSGECVPTGNGCGGMKVQGGGCEYTSAKLSQVLACMNQNGVTAPVTSVTLNQNSDWCQKCVWNYAGSGYCSHMQNSCHFGGANCKGTAQAADIGGKKGAELSAIAAAAQGCGAEYVLYNAPSHYDHVHLSVNTAQCGCH